MNLPNINILFEKNKIWKNYRYLNYAIWYAGEKKFIESLVLEIIRSDSKISSLKKILLRTSKNFSLILSSKDFFICCTDFIRSYPIFYLKDKNSIYISNSNKTLEKLSKNVNLDSVYQCISAGFVTEENTIFDKIKCLGAGKLIAKYYNNSSLYHETYFKFNSTIKKKKNSKIQLEDELYNVLDVIFEDLIEKSNGNQIVIPLSGGLDSRLILSKLLEKKYDNIFTFSYGLKNNSDAFIAKEIAQKLHVKWEFIEFNKDLYRKYYRSDFKKKYDQYSDNSSVLPNYQDIFFINELKQKKMINKNAIIVNGQTGDFISGGQLPENFDDYYLVESVIDFLKKKHFDLWNEIKFLNVNNNIQNNIKKKFSKIFYKNIIDVIDAWNFEERQVKYIINGQRAYDFLGYNWFLPFWDPKYIKFWNSVTTENKVNQNLYKFFLKNWNYKNLFNFNSYREEAFSKKLNYVVKFISFTLNFLNPILKKKYILMYMDYFSRYGYMYNFFSYKLFFKYRSKIRNPFSLHIIRWLLDKGLKKELLEINKKEKLFDYEDFLHL